MKTSKNFQIWTKCVENRWKEIEYHSTKENFIVPEQLLNILGEQNVEGNADRDRDDDDGDDDEGVEMTNMVDKEIEDESD